MSKSGRHIGLNETARAWYSAAVRTAAIAGIFCLLASALIVWNHVRLVSSDPRQSRRLAALEADLKRHPKDERLKVSIRKLDRDLRSEYVRRLAFAHYGSYVLLWGLGVFLVAAPAAVRLRKTGPLPKGELPTAQLARLEAAHARRSVAVFGALAVGSLAVLALMSSEYLPRQYEKAVRSYKPSPSAAEGPTGPAAAQPIVSGPAPSAPSVPAAVGPVAPLMPPQPSVGGGKALALETVPFDPEDYWPSAADAARNWPVFRGPSGAGHVASGSYPTRWSGANGEGIRWKTEIPLPGQNSPIVWGDRVFLSGATENKREIYCFDAGSGKLLWKREARALTNAQPPRVSADAGYAAPTVAVDGRRVFAIFPTGDVVCYDSNGRRLWARSLGAPDSNYGHASSLAMYRSLLIIQFDQGGSEKDGKSAIMALQAGTGKLVWITGRPVPNSWSTPVVIGTGSREELITCANPWVIAYDPMTGKELWRANCLGGDVAPSPIYAGGLVYACNADACLAAIRPGGSGDVTKSHILWRAIEGLPSIASPASSGDLIFLVTTEGTITCYDAKQGKKVWDHDMGIMFKASPTVVGGRVYLLDSEGVMHVLQAGHSFEEESKSALGEKTDATPAFIDGRIYIRGEKHLFCIGG